MVDFGEKVRALREARGLSQVQFAELLGVTKGMISAYETSVRMPSYKVLIRIARQIICWVWNAKKGWIPPDLMRGRSSW